MILKSESIKKLTIVFLISLTAMILSHWLVGEVNIDLSELFHRHIDSTSFYIEFAPEIWLTLMSIVLGTLIIVISIASQSNPKLIDYYIGDYPSLYYTCLITLAGIENIYLQLNLEIDSLFWKNVIFLNAYFLLPVAIINAIPYAFYILSYTKTSSLIRTIFKRNKQAIKTSFARRSVNYRKAQLDFLETVNQLDDQYGFVPFKEPKSQIIISIGELFRYYLQHKHLVNQRFFTVGDVVRADISFRTLSDKYTEIEARQSFAEHKMLRIYSGLYFHQLENGHHDLASQSASELCKTGIAAVETNNTEVISLVLMQFNTYLRFGIKYGSQNKDVRHVYNCIFHYTQFILHLIRTKHERQIIEACEYLTYYGKEIYKLSFTESHMIFLIDALASEVQRILIAIHDAGYPKDLQLKILKIYANIEPSEIKKELLDRVKNNTARSIKIALILFYINRQEKTLISQLIRDIIDDLRYFNEQETLEIIKKDCKMLMSGKPTFWEFTDRGDKNIYYTDYKQHIREFYHIFSVACRKSKNPSNDLSINAA